MDKLYSQATIRGMKEKYDFRFSKSLGQNFLTDGNLIAKIVDGAEIAEGDAVIEIGPGMGALTAEIAERAAAVLAVEIDHHLIPILKETLGAFENTEILQGDIMKADIGELIVRVREKAGNNNASVKVLGNLPYYITTPILLKLLKEEG